MLKINLTQSAAERLPLPPKGSAAVTYFDTHLAGFGIRVSPKGRKTFIAQYRVKGGREVLETITTMALATNVIAAREQARESMRLAHQGIDPVRSRQAAVAAEQASLAASQFTFEKLAARYIAEHAQVNTRPTTYRETRRYLGHDAPHFAQTPVTQITKAQVIELVHGKRTGLIEQTNLLATVRRRFRRGSAHDLCTDPTAGVLKPLPKSVQRDRVLDDKGIGAFWSACGEIGWPFGPLFKLLLLTGQREGEVAGMRWSELYIANATWYLPGETVPRTVGPTTFICLTWL